MILESVLVIEIKNASNFPRTDKNAEPWQWLVEGACSQKLRTLIPQSTHFTLSEVNVFKITKT